jgi:D-glycero-D-manno-heptose 1,7-bisphosphate phosphatase
MSDQPPIEQAAILCGGLGTRLGTLTADIPKPLLPVSGKPFLEVLLEELGRSGVRRIVLLAGFASERIADFVAAGPLKGRFDLRIEVAVEPFAAGTGGALWHAKERLEERFFLLNGDSWFDIPLARLAAPLAGEPAAIGALALRPVDDTARYGSVTVAGDRIAAFSERAPQPGPGLISGGVYAFRRSLVDHLGERCSLERDVLPPLAAAGALRGVAFDGYFIDIGIPEDLARAQREIPKLQRLRVTRENRSPPATHTKSCDD